MGTFHRVAKKVFFGRFQRPWRWPKDVPQDHWERVAFRSGNGARLAGLFGTARSGPAVGAVALAHPMGAAAKGFWLKHGHAELLRQSGFDVLAFDFNGFGESESSDFDFPADVLAAGQYLRERTGLPVGIVGSSFGAGYAVCAMAKPAHPFRAAVLEGTFPSLPYYWRQYPIPRTLLRASQLVYPKLERELRPVRAAAELKHMPYILLIHGESDSVAPVHVGDQLRQAMSGQASVELWSVPEADHTLAYQAQRDGYSARVTAFLRRTLAPPAQH